MESSARAPASTAAPLYALKFLLPPVLATAIAGEGDVWLGDLAKTCQVHPTLSNARDWYSNHIHHILLAQAETTEALDKLSQEVVAKLADVCMSSGYLWLSTVVPKSAVAALIGKGGCTIRQLCEDTGADVRANKVGMPFPSNEQRVDIKGEAAAIESVLQHINFYVQSLAQEVWFADWAKRLTPIENHKEPDGRDRDYRRGGQAGMDLVQRTMENLPPFVVEESRGFAITCMVPNELVGRVLGRGGCGVQEVQQATKTRIVVRDSGNSDTHRCMFICGPLLSACSAYMMMMQRYLEAERHEEKCRYLQERYEERTRFFAEKAAREE